MELVVTAAGSTAVAASATHPHAAMLWVDFILGAEGQKIFKDLYYGNPTMDYGFKRWLPEAGESAEGYDAKLRHWERLIRPGSQRG